MFFWYNTEVVLLKTGGEIGFLRIKVLNMKLGSNKSSGIWSARARNPISWYDQK